MVGLACRIALRQMPLTIPMRGLANRRYWMHIPAPFVYESLLPSGVIPTKGNLAPPSRIEAYRIAAWQQWEHRMVEQTSRVSQIHFALRRAIIEQALEPGAKLPEDTIGEQFHVSRTIARRALELLAAEELVEFRPNRGASVVSPTLEQAHDLFAVRIDIERIVGRRICGKLSRADVARLNKHVANEELALRHNRPDYIRLAAYFHVLLAELSGSPQLLRYITQLVWRSALVLRLHGRPQWHTCNVQEHLDLIAALEAGDKSRTDRLLTAHLESVLTRALEGGTIEGEPKLGEVLSRYSSQSAISKVEATNRKKRGAIHGKVPALVGKPHVQREAS
jgi:DNA-binding GntR family transcriptional regulator